MPLTRRQLLQTSACGFGSLALAGLCAREAAAEGSSAAKATSQPLDPRSPHFAPRAKRVIFLFMMGGPSHVDTFDFKPELQKRDGQDMPGGVPEAQKSAGRQLRKLMASPFRWQQHGQSGLWASELFPHVAEHMDDLCVINSMHTEGFDHANATLKLHTGAVSLTRPSLGSWVVYGLGSHNDSLPGFITICPDRGRGTRNHSNAFLPSVYQGLAIGHDGVPAREATIRHLANARLSPTVQRRQLEYLRQLNREHRARTADDDQLDGLIRSYELAFRMQREAPRHLDLSDETPHTLAMYGIDERPTDDFGRQCLMARRFAEAGVRFIQVTHTIRRHFPGVANWDQHNDLVRDLPRNCRAVDRPIAALLADLKQRGMLDDTLVIWGGEFGRTPVAEHRSKAVGRDHNPLGYTMWLAGGGVRAGHVHGATDAFGYRATEDRVYMHDLHATVLHLLGLDHERLTYRYAGRDFRLTDVYGRVVKGILA
ncbi:MAG: DUF1501 domain-containing protein [Planctomycetota bacterium]|nr:MAG: DUF1501 domain-containing protein [Planctomycetota bacterium]REJ90031.1 MAG: DUF1501 domain-containing protein [Planctomycetota bacterium]REK22409.1 MAG: DUF1501 domain-containing protein [Planctomycetota bacterium]REK39769.1 MAG: DUF1501 domain-containing protein [Planctomycetota bacterium]